MKLKNKEKFFWIGWAIWICMVVVKAALVFSGDDFQWDPMFLLVPASFIFMGVQRCEHCEKCKCECHKKEE